MTPGSIQQILTWSAAQAVNAGEPERAAELSDLRDGLDALFASAHAALEGAERNPDGSNSYCIPADQLDKFSADLARVGGAS